MYDGTTLTIQLPSETNQRLADLAVQTGRSSSYLAAEAITAYVTRELNIVDAIVAGQDDIRNGRLTPHDDVVKQVKQVISACRKQR
jgi:predicted transcriptional regulator